VSDGAAGTIVQVTNWNSPYLGNFMASELALAEAVRARFGLATHLVLGVGGGEQPWTADLDAAGVTWSEIPADAKAARDHLVHVLRERDGLLLHSHFTSWDLAAAAAARTVGVPCLWHMHTGFLGYPLKQRLKDLWKIRVIRRRSVARVIAVGPALAELAARRGVPAAQIVVIPNALVLDRFADPPDRTAARARLGLAPDATVALTFGWWPEAKGTDVMLDALATLDADGTTPPVTGLLVGEEQLRALVAERYGATPPAWLAQSGFVDDPAWLYAAADFFVSASRHEGQPYSVGEALACGLPAVLSSIPGTRLYEQAPGTTTFPSGDAAALAAAIAKMVALPPEARTAAQEGNRAWAQANLSIERWCDGLCDLYAELLDR
jgi:glycosyltransferase involved in cell wall biosynthesis